MERYFTDAVYARRVRGRPPELERMEKQLYAELSAHISGEEYLRIEENLNFFHEELGKELFGRGFMEGMLIRMMSVCIIFTIYMLFFILSYDNISYRKQSFRFR